jgi:hypothetical protein
MSVDDDGPVAVPAAPQTGGVLPVWLSRRLRVVGARLPVLIACAAVIAAAVVVVDVVVQLGYPRRADIVAARFVAAPTCEAGGKYAVDGYLQSCDGSLVMPMRDVTVLTVSPGWDGDRATVELIGDVRGETVQDVVRLIRHDGKWKVATLSTGA